MARAIIAAALAAALGMSGTSTAAQGLGSGLSDIFGIFLGDTESGELRATIWVDPDGCEHWVMDDGIEGFMSAHLDRNGKPVCRGLTGNGICKTFDGPTLFSTNSARLTDAARVELSEYFETITGSKIFVNGHTDNVGGDDFNLKLSLDRAMAVSDFAKSFGVMAEPRGIGEQAPIADNATAEGRAKNRRVELTCG